MTDDRDDLTARLRGLHPTAGQGVDFDVVRSQARSRHRRRRLGQGLGAAALVAAIAVVVPHLTPGIQRGGFTAAGGPPPAASPVAPGTSPEANRADSQSTTAPPPKAAAPVLPAPTPMPTDPTAAARCPASIATREEIPASQTVAGFDPATRMLPDRPATTVTICHYDVADALTGARPAPYLLTGAGTVADPRSMLRDIGSVAPGDPRQGPCTLMAGPVATMLLRVDYPEGRAWVRAVTDVNACSGASNGTFQTAAYVAGGLEGTLRTGTWAGLRAR